MEANTLKKLLRKLFQEYDLTKNEAIVLTNLTHNNTYLSAKHTSEISKIARETTYTVLFNLKEKGLIEKTITRPKKYCAIPLKLSLRNLHEQKNKKIHKLETLSIQVLLNYKHNPNNTQFEERAQFILVPKKNQLKKRVEQAISNSNKNISVITSWKRFLNALIIYEIAINKALFNGVKIQVLINEKGIVNKNTEDTKHFYEHPNTLVKFIDCSPTVVNIIIDNQQVFLMIKPKSDLGQSSALWSNNEGLITALSTCFGTFWKNLTP